MGCTAETLRNWVRQAERDTGTRPGLTTTERERLKELEREVRELRRANEISKRPRTRRPRAGSLLPAEHGRPHSPQRSRSK